jgi:hypothetical protein
MRGVITNRDVVKNLGIIFWEFGLLCPPQVSVGPGDPPEADVPGRGRSLIG